jgi:hypothetical protein
MKKQIDELKQPIKQYPPELLKEMKKIMRQLELNGEEVSRQLAEVEKELSAKRNSNETF